MADEINVGRLVAEIVLESETKKAEQEVAQSAKNIKDTLKDVANTDIKVEVSVDSKSAIDEAKQAQQEIQTYLNNNLSVVSDPKAYKDLLNNLITPDKPLEMPVAIVPEETSADDMLQKIEEYLCSIGIKATDVEAVMSSCFGDLSVYIQYEKQLNIIATKLELQREKVADLKSEQEKLSSSGNLTDVQVKNVEKITQQYENEVIKLQQLENQFDKTALAQDNYVNRKVSAYQKSVEAAEKATLKEQQAAEQAVQKQQQLADNLSQILSKYHQ